MSAIKMDELLVSWLGSDGVYENVMELIEGYRASMHEKQDEKKEDKGDNGSTNSDEDNPEGGNNNNGNNGSRSPTGVIIPPFYPVKVAGRVRRRRQVTVSQRDTWDPLPEGTATTDNPNNAAAAAAAAENAGGAQQPPAPAPPLLPQLDAPSDHLSPRPKIGNQNNKLGAGNNNNSLNATNSSEEGDGSKNGEEDNKGEDANANAQKNNEPSICVRDQATAIYKEMGQDPPLASPTSDDAMGSHSHSMDSTDDDDAAGGATTIISNKKLAQKYLTTESFVRITKDVCGFPSFFNIPLYARILFLWNHYHHHHHLAATGDGGPLMMTPPPAADPGMNQPLPMEVITFEMFEWFWKTEMEPYDPCDRFFRLIKQTDSDAIVRDDFLPFIKALLQDHPGLEFLSSHAEFQEKYAVTVITRIFYCVNKCHSGRITARQVRRSDLLEAFQQVDEEEDINKVTRYFSYEHFYVLYCRFWELDHDRDYRITREDLLKYGDQSLSHMIVDRIFDAAPRPFEQQLQQAQAAAALEDGVVRPPPPVANHRDYLSYEDFIYFMLSEEDKSNEVSVRYWFTCVDVDGDGKLNNMEMRSFYAVQLHRMQFMGHEIVPFEDMLCQMMDMIKPASTEWLVETDFLQPECRQVSGALFDALFNLNKYLLFEQRDPFVERQKREDEFDCDWDRFACLDYSRLAMEEEAREEEAMEIDWVTVDDDEEDDDEEGGDDEDDDEEDEDDAITEDDDSESDLQGAMLGQPASEAPF